MCEQEVEVEGQRGYEVNHVDGSAEERQSARTDCQAYEQFEREPAVADALDVEEGVVWNRSSFVEQPGRRRAHRHVAAVATTAHVHAGRQTHVAYRRHAHVGMSFETERQDRDDDEQH